MSRSPPPSRFAAPVRTGTDRMRDVDLFLGRATDTAIMAQTGEKLAGFYGVKDVRAVEAKLLARQDVLRRRVQG